MTVSPFRVRNAVPFRVLTIAALALVLAAPAYAQATWGDIAGRITSAQDGSPIPGATVLVDGTNYGTAANDDGIFRFRVPEGRYALLIRAVGFETVTDSVRVVKRQETILDVRLNEATVELGTAVVEGEGVRGEAGVFTLSPDDIRSMPTPVADALRGVKVLPGVTSNNETSNAYSVRGGGYNENQFFVDGFEIYRPLRTNQGEQEGLGLVNADLTERMTLYAGGFPSRYGGKLASVLDVAYARPSGIPTGSAYGSTLDAGLAVRGGVGALGLAVAGRSARPQRFFAGQELKGTYDPDFRDIQGLATYALAEGHELRVLGMLARHRFRLDPSQRRTTFGVFPNNIRSVSFQFDGEESDGYDIAFGGVRLTDRFGAIRVEHDVSYFSIDEFEDVDVEGNVTLFRGEPDPDNPPSDPLTFIQTGQARQRDIAHNRVNARTVTGGGRYRLGLGRHAAEAGWTLRSLSFDDLLEERTLFEGRDSLGNPVTITVDALEDSSVLDTWQAALWVEDAIDLLAPGRLVVTGGVRADYFAFTDEWTISPRLSGRYRLDDRTTLSAAAGVYHQMPTYRELRGEVDMGDSTIVAALNPDLKSQRATLGTVGLEHFFPNTRIAVRAEAWYKDLDHLISYELDNVRVVYSGENDSQGYAYGLDLQVRGELVPGLESWLNYGFLVAREEFQDGFMTPRNDGLLPRPTDRRHNVALFVQDYVPGDDTWTLHLRTLYGSGLPYTPPALSERIEGVSVLEPGPRNDARYPGYFRFDMGATKRIRVGQGLTGPLWLKATAEVLNVFNMKNTITYSFVDSGRGFFEGVPTRLTPRTVNIRLRLDF